MSSDSDGESHDLDGGHVDTATQHVTPSVSTVTTPATPIDTASLHGSLQLMTGQPTITVPSIGMPQTAVQAAVPQMLPMFPSNSGALPQGTKLMGYKMVLNALRHYHGPNISKV